MGQEKDVAQYIAYRQRRLLKPRDTEKKVDWVKVACDEIKFDEERRKEWECLMQAKRNGTYHPRKFPHQALLRPQQFYPRTSAS